MTGVGVVVLADDARREGSGRQLVVANQTFGRGRSFAVDQGAQHAGGAAAGRDRVAVLREIQRQVGGADADARDRYAIASFELALRQHRGRRRDQRGGNGGNGMATERIRTIRHGPGLLIDRMQVRRLQSWRRRGETS
jgi:hypothetical protein